jgi:hypothetical protein
MLSSFERRISQCRACGLLLTALLALSACSGAPEAEPVQSVGSALGDMATGPAPSGLPARFLIGLNDGGGSWMPNSGVPWDARYRYFTKGWPTWTGDADVATFMNLSRSQGYIPALAYYQLVSENPSGDETKDLAKIQNAGTMSGYFNDFKTMMQRVKAFGAPVLVMLEADGFGFIEQQCMDNPNLYAAVKDSGVPELAGLPNTVAGWGLAFLAIKKAVGANNALLGLHLSAWSTGPDLGNGDPTVPLQEEVDAGYWFFSKLGLATNPTGITYDFLVADPSDRDADFYKLTKANADHWWDTSDTAPITSLSFNHYAEWLRLWNVKSGKRFVLWQIPEGNSNHLDVNNSGGARQGYKDNRPEYFLGSGTAHISKFAQSGVIALLFGAGAGGQSSHTNDTWTDGKLYIQSHADSILRSGQLAIGGGLTWTPPVIPATPRPVPPPILDGYDHIYEFETDTQKWTTAPESAEAGANVVSKIEWSTAKAFRGKGSLAVTFNGAAGSGKVFIPAAAVPAETPVDFHIWVPTGSALVSVQAFASINSTWESKWTGIKDISPNVWKALQVVTPTKFFRWDIGLVFTVTAGFTGTIYVDTVGWPGNVPPGADAGSFPEGGGIAVDGGRILPSTTGAGGSSSAGTGTGTGTGTPGAGGADVPIDGTDPDATDGTTNGGCACREARTSSRDRTTLPAAVAALMTLGVASLRVRKRSAHRTVRANRY